MAAASMNRAGNVSDMAARAMETVPSSVRKAYIYPVADLGPTGRPYGMTCQRGISGRGRDCACRIVEATVWKMSHQS